MGLRASEKLGRAVWGGRRGSKDADLWPRRAPAQALKAAARLPGRTVCSQLLEWP